MLRTIPLLSAFIMVLGNSAIANAAEPVQKMTPERECELHQPNTTDCHVHEKETYLHLKDQRPDKLPPHARAEYRELDHQYGRDRGR